MSSSTIIVIFVLAFLANAVIAEQLLFRVNNDFVFAITQDQLGNMIYVAGDQSCVVSLDTTTLATTTIAGYCPAFTGLNGVPGVATSAHLGYLDGLAVDSANNVYGHRSCHVEEAIRESSSVTVVTDN